MTHSPRNRKVLSPFTESDRLFSGWTQVQSEALRTIAIALPLLIILIVTPHKLLTLILVFLTTAGWQWLFARKRFHSLGIDLFFTVFLFTLLLPDTINWWQLLMSVSFGVVLGEQIYGGRGYSFINPVVTGLAFAFYSFELGGTLAVNALPLWVLLPSMGLLLWYRLLDWRFFVGVLLGISILFLLLTSNASITAAADIAAKLLPSIAVVACLIFAAGDAAICPATIIGRWVYGMLLGALLLLLDPTLTLLEKTVYASLLASVAVPLIDWLCVALELALKQARRAGARDV